METVLSSFDTLPGLCEIHCETEQRNLSVLDQITCTPATVTTPVFKHSTTRFLSSKGKGYLSACHSPRVQYLSYLPKNGGLLREKRLLLSCTGQPQNSQKVKKKELHNKISYSTGANVVNITRRGLYLDRCVYLKTVTGTRKPTRMR